jgi:pseudouridylate synthase
VQFLAFFCRESGFGVDHTCQTEAELARVIKTKWDIGLQGGVLIGNPIPPEYAMDFDEMEKIISKAVAEAEKQGIQGKEVTLFLLREIKELTGGDSYTTNLQLLYNNARNASKLAVELSKLYNA